MGRPPANTRADTRVRILTAARYCFARKGYAHTTNKDIAERADITTGAIYHYFESKQALFAAVAEEAHSLVFGEFERVVAVEENFLDRIRAVLDVAVKLHEQDRSLAAFTVTSPIDVQRHPELRAAIDPAILNGTQRFFATMAADAQRAGELGDEVEADAVAVMITALTQGLARLGAEARRAEVLKAAVDAVERLFAGTLLTASRRG